MTSLYKFLRLLCCLFARFSGVLSKALSYKLIKNIAIEIQFKKNGILPVGFVEKNSNTPNCLPLVT